MEQCLCIKLEKVPGNESSVFIKTSATMTAVSSSAATTCANLFALSSSVAALLAVAGAFGIYTNFLIGRDSHFT